MSDQKVVNSKARERKTERAVTKPYSKSSKTKSKSSVHRYAITLGEQAELRVGLPKIGTGLADTGFSVAELTEIHAKLRKQGVACELRMLSDLLDEKHRDGNEAAVLHIKAGVNAVLERGDGADAMLKEQDEVVHYDAQHWSTKHGRAVNSVARRNVMFAAVGTSHSSDYKQGTIVAWTAVPLLSLFRQRASVVFGDKAKALNAEGNFYYHDKSGIGFHGDGERKRVIGISLGTTMTLRFYWRAPQSSKVHKGPSDLVCEHGDVYIMSEKASGWDWHHRSKHRLVHAAGAPSFQM